jgi:hypothetical protein
MSPITRHPADPAKAALMTKSELISSIEGMRVISLPEAARLNGISVDTIRRQHPDKILKMSDKRIGMRLKDALSLARPLDAA